MVIQKLTQTECDAILARTHVGHLACARHDQPYVVPVHFSYDAPERCLYSFSAVGQKIAWMRANPKVCFEVEDITDKDHWTTVIVTGRYVEISQRPEEADVRQRARQLFQQRPEWWFPGAAKTTTREHPDVVIYRIYVDSITGRRAARSV
jgi:uncharacterized protein